jgi:hypothetical protein
MKIITLYCVGNETGKLVPLAYDAKSFTVEQATESVNRLGFEVIYSYTR